MIAISGKPVCEAGASGQCHSSCSQQILSNDLSMVIQIFLKVCLVASTTPKFEIKKCLFLESFEDNMLKSVLKKIYFLRKVRGCKHNSDSL